jgi:hypothetical protein
MDRVTNNQSNVVRDRLVLPQNNAPKGWIGIGLYN